MNVSFLFSILCIGGMNIYYVVHCSLPFYLIHNNQKIDVSLLSNIKLIFLPIQHMVEVEIKYISVPSLKLSHISLKITLNYFKVLI